MTGVVPTELLASPHRADVRVGPKRLPSQCAQNRGQGGVAYRVRCLWQLIRRQ